MEYPGMVVKDISENTSHRQNWNFPQQEEALHIKPDDQVIWGRSS